MVHNGLVILDWSRAEAAAQWSWVSYQPQKLRDNPECAEEAFAELSDDDDPGLNCEIPSSLAEQLQAPMVGLNTRPEVAILREQGVNECLLIEQLTQAIHDQRWGQLFLAQSTARPPRGAKLRGIHRARALCLVHLKENRAVLGSSRASVATSAITTVAATNAFGE